MQVLNAMTQTERLIKRTDIRNVAIIAHVDHGKTTLVDGMLRLSRIFLLVLAEDPALSEHPVDEGGLPVVDVGDDRDVSDVGALHRCNCRARRPSDDRFFLKYLLLIPPTRLPVVQ